MFCCASRKLMKERGLDLKGKKCELLARLYEDAAAAGVDQDQEAAAQSGEGSKGGKGNAAAPAKGKKSKGKSKSKSKSDSAASTDAPSIGTHYAGLTLSEENPLLAVSGNGCGSMPTKSRIDLQQIAPQIGSPALEVHRSYEQTGSTGASVVVGEDGITAYNAHCIETDVSSGTNRQVQIKCTNERKRDSVTLSRKYMLASNVSVVACLCGLFLCLFSTLSSS
jgi:hypothetical protein